MAIERITPATPIEGELEAGIQVDIDPVNASAMETEDGGMLIDFDPNAFEQTGDFFANLADEMTFQIPQYADHQWQICHLGYFDKERLELMLRRAGGLRSRPSRSPIPSTRCSSSISSLKPLESSFER